MIDGEAIPPRPRLDGWFPFPVPAAFVELVDVAWWNAFRKGSFHLDDFEDFYGAVPFSLTFDDSPFREGLPGTPVSLTGEQMAMPVRVAPEFFPFGVRTDATAVGWVVPAPELNRSDHPVAITGEDQMVGYAGPGTRSGLEWLMSHVLRGERVDPHPEWWTATYGRIRREIFDRLVAALDLRPDPDAVPDMMLLKEVKYPLPAGWRTVRTVDGMGVLAPAGAFAPRDPIRYDESHYDSGQSLWVSGGEEARLMDGPVLDDAVRLLDDGHPATALVELRDAFIQMAPFELLKEPWQRAYRMLGRPTLADALDTRVRA